MNNQLNIKLITETSSNLNMDYLDNLATENLTNQDFINQMKIKYKFLYDNYQTIFNISITENFDLDRLIFMLTMANKVKCNELSEHDASVKVGEELVHNIVKPQLDKAGIKPNK